MDKNKFTKALAWAFSASLFLSVLIFMDGCAPDSTLAAQKEKLAVQDAISKLGKLEGFRPRAEDFASIREEVKKHIYPYFKNYFPSKNKTNYISKQSLDKVFKQELQFTGELKTAVEKVIEGTCNFRWYSSYPASNSPFVHFIITAIATCHYLEQFCEKEIDDRQKKALQTFLDDAPYRVSSSWDERNYYLVMNGYEYKGEKIEGLSLIKSQSSASRKSFNAPKKLEEAEKIMEEALSNFSQAIQLYQ